MLGLKVIIAHIERYFDQDKRLVNRLLDNPDLLIQCNAEFFIEKKTASKKATANQEANEVLKGEIKAYLADNATERYTASELAKQFGVSLPKVSALLTQLKNAGEVNREVEKKTAYFSAV